MMPGTRTQPSDDELGWSQHRTAEQLAAICAEIRSPVGTRAYVIDDPHETLRTDGEIQQARTRVVVEVDFEGSDEHPAYTRGLCVDIPTLPSARTMFGAIFQGLLAMEADDLAADFVLDGWPIFESGGYENHAELNPSGQGYVDHFAHADRPDGVAATTLTPDSGPSVIDLDVAGGIEIVDEGPTPGTMPVGLTTIGDQGPEIWDLSKTLAENLAMRPGQDAPE